MKRKYQLYGVLILMTIGIYTPNFSAQNPSYVCTLANDALTANNVYEFDIYLLRIGDVPFELGGIQFGFLYNDGIRNGGTITASYVPGSVDEGLITSGQQNNLFNTAVAGVIKISANLAPRGHGSGAIISSVAPGTRIGRLRLTNSVAFAALRPNILFNYSLHPYATKISAYVGDFNTDITDVKNFKISLSNPILAGSGSGIELPKTYNMELYHANPWSPNVTISYTLPFQSEVNLTVYNSIGEKVKDLVGSVQKGGFYEIKFDAKSLPGGVYFFTIKCTASVGENNFTSTKKIVYIK
jgi:hypothetical protein